MRNHRAVCGSATFLLGSAQAWDSGILRAEPAAIAAVAAAIVLLSVAAWLRWPAAARAGAVAVSFALVVAVRLLSDTPLPELGLVAFFGALVVLVLQPLMERGERLRDGAAA